VYFTSSRTAGGGARQGSIRVDARGNQYLDFFGGIVTISVGIAMRR